MNLAKLIRLWENLEAEYEEDNSLSDRIRQARTYVDARLYRADVVPSIPPVGEAGKFYVTAGDTNVYVGTGSGMRRIPTQAVP